MTKVLFQRARLTPRRPLQSVLIDTDRVAEIGATMGPVDVSEVIDLGGRYLLRGLWDRHVHFDQWAQVAARLDLSVATSALAAAGLVAAHARARQPNLRAPIVGYGFRDALWPDAPDRGLLDSVAEAVPVVLISADLHSAWLNSAALRRFGHAELTAGLLREDAAMQVISEVGKVSDDTADAWCRSASRTAASRGVVGVVDMEKPGPLEAWRRRMAGGDRLLRVAASVWPERLDAAIAGRLHTGDVIAGTSGLLTVGPMKVIIDGSLNTRTAWCHDAYAPPAEGVDEHGMLLVPADELAALMLRARDAGFECAVHAIGDRANAIALDAFAGTGARGSIEHAQLLDDADVIRFAQTSVGASVQPEHALDDRDIADRFWGGRTRRAFAFRALLDAGARLSFGSDAPVAPLDPWLEIAAAVHRSRDARPPWHPEQEITVAEALAASMVPTRRDPALRSGDAADLIVVDGDPFADAPSALRSMPVAATMVGGSWTHRARI